MKFPPAFLLLLSGTLLLVIMSYNQLVSCGHELRAGNQLYQETNKVVVNHCQVSDGAVCYKCESQYYLFNNTCIEKDSSCLEYVDNYGCAKCTDGAFLIKTIHYGRDCMYCSEMCEKCANYVGCVQCLEDFRKIVANFDGAYYDTCHF